MQEAQTQAAEAVTAAQLTHALKMALPYLEHPDVNAIPFCGSPRAVAEHIRSIIGAESPRQQFAFPVGERHNAKVSGAGNEDRTD